jgi:hypothetical protein
MPKFKRMTFIEVADKLPVFGVIILKMKFYQTSWKIQIIYFWTTALIVDESVFYKSTLKLQ